MVCEVNLGTRRRERERESKSDMTMREPKQHPHHTPDAAVDEQRVHERALRRRAAAARLVPQHARRPLDRDVLARQVGHALAVAALGLRRRDLGGERHREVGEEQVLARERQPEQAVEEATDCCFRVVWILMGKGERRCVSFEY